MYNIAVHVHVCILVCTAWSAVCVPLYLLVFITILIFIILATGASFLVGIYHYLTGIVISWWYLILESSFHAGICTCYKQHSIVHCTVFVLILYVVEPLY